MRSAGVSDETIAARRADALALYLDRLEAALRERPPVLKPGVLALLDALENVPGLVLALLTGNVERGARLKLSYAGIWHRFRFGVWGDDGSCRDALGPVALTRAGPATGLTFAGSECVVVGDSRHDVACGLSLGARAWPSARGAPRCPRLPPRERTHSSRTSPIRRRPWRRSLADSSRSLGLMLPALAAVVVLSAGPLVAFDAPRRLSPCGSALRPRGADAAPAVVHGRHRARRGMSSRSSAGLRTRRRRSGTSRPPRTPRRPSGPKASRPTTSTGDSSRRSRARRTRSCRRSSRRSLFHAGPRRGRDGREAGGRPRGPAHRLASAHRHSGHRVVRHRAFPRRLGLRRGRRPSATETAWSCPQTCRGSRAISLRRRCRGKSS